MRCLLLILGLLTLTTVWLTVLPQLARQAFWAHMAMHMGVVAIAAPLLALGVAGGRLHPAQRVPHLFAPIPASIVELIVVWAWHAPVLHHTARHTTAGLVAEQGMFLLSGLFVWLSAFGGAPTPTACDGNRIAAGIVGLLLTSMHMTLLALTPRSLYAHVVGFAGLTPLEDQHLGGVIMLLVGGVAYLVGGLWLTAALMRGAAVRMSGR